MDATFLSLLSSNTWISKSPELVVKFSLRMLLKPRYLPCIAQLIDSRDVDLTAVPNKVLLTLRFILLGNAVLRSRNENQNSSKTTLLLWLSTLSKQLNCSSLARLTGLRLSEQSASLLCTLRATLWRRSIGSMKSFLRDPCIELS